MTNIGSRIVKHGKFRFDGRIAWERFERAIVWSEERWNNQTNRFELRVEKAVFRLGFLGRNEESNEMCLLRFRRF
jgi:hypothetical protein